VIELRGTTWDHPRGWGGVRAAADAFTRQRTDVRVSWEMRSLQAFADHPIDVLATTYDLIVLDHPSIGSAVARGALLPLDPHLDRRALDDQASSSVGRSYESYSWQGHQWALAIDAAAQVAAYRPDLLDGEVPTTWEQVAATQDRLGHRVAVPAIPVDAICAFLGTCGSLGEEPLASDDRVVGRDVGREALEVLAHVVRRAHPMSLTSSPPTILDRMANTNQIAYVPLAFGYANYARSGFARHQLRFAPGPGAATSVGGPIIPSGTLGGAGLAVSSSTAHPDAACAYTAFTASGEVQRTTYAQGGGQPAHRGAWTDRQLNDETGAFFASTLRALDQAYLRPRSDGFLAFQDMAGDLVHRYLRGGGGADRVLDALDASYRSTLVTTAGADR
jgi:multiple sugar transport system substrate-binding protein